MISPKCEVGELELLKETFEGMGKIKTQRMYSIQRAKMKGIYK